MAIRIGEIMNREVYAAKLQDDAVRVRRDLVQLGISGAPVLDDQGRPLGVVSLKDLAEVPEGSLIVDRVSTPAVATSAGSSIVSAARLMAETHCHRLVVLEGDRAVGMVSTLDVMRALAGLPVSHPASFPHYDPKSGAVWSDNYPLDWSHVEAAPTSPGVMLIFGGGAGKPETLIWGECNDNLRERLLLFLESPAEGPAILTHWKERGAISFRTATILDLEAQKQVLRDAMV